MFSLDVRKKFYTQIMVGHWNGSPEKWSQHQLDRVEEAFGQYSQAHDCDIWR